MTGKRFNFHIDEVSIYYYVCEQGEILAETYGSDDAEDIANRLNELWEEKEYWKGNACSHSNFINILLHELDIAQEQGYEISNPFKKLIEEKR